MPGGGDARRARPARLPGLPRWPLVDARGGRLGGGGGGGGRGRYGCPMAGGCCDPRGCDQFFGPRFARYAANRYRRHGLDRSAQRMVQFVADRGIEGATVLEVGGGAGEIQIELLKRGAGRAVNLELSSAYDAQADELLRAAGLQGRAVRRLHDIAVDPAGVEAADVVVLHRWSAAIRTTSGCWPPPASTPGGCWSSATRATTPAPGWH